MKNPIIQRLVNDLEKELFGKTEPGHCVSCKQKFSSENTFTEKGWIETKNSRLCEKCYEDISRED
jgi:hypothetical protein